MNWENGELNTPQLRIQVTKNHIYYKGVWVMHVREFNWSCKQIEVNATATEEDAQVAAIKQVRAHLLNMINSLP